MAVPLFRGLERSEALIFSLSTEHYSHCARAWLVSVSKPLQPSLMQAVELLRSGYGRKSFERHAHAYACTCMYPNF